MLYMPKPLYQSGRDQEIKILRRQIRELELEMRGQRQRKDLEEPSREHESTSGRKGGPSHRSHLQLSKDRLNYSRGRHLKSPSRERQGHPSAALDAMSRALRKVVHSPFSEEIECTKMPRHFTRPPFIYYNRKTDPVEHVSHYIQLMTLYSRNDRLIYKVFPSSLRFTVMRWFNSLRKGSIIASHS